MAIEFHLRLHAKRFAAAADQRNSRLFRGETFTARQKVNCLYGCDLLR